MGYSIYLSIIFNVSQIKFHIVLYNVINYNLITIKKLDFKLEIH